MNYCSDLPNYAESEAPPRAAIIFNRILMYIILLFKYFPSGFETPESSTLHL